MSPRPAVDALIVVDDAEWVVKFIHPVHYDASAPATQRILSSWIQTKELTPTATNYGPSAFVESKLNGGLADLYAARPQWTTFGVIRVQVKNLKTMNVPKVCYTPMDCLVYPTIAHAHASFIGLSTRRARDELLQKLETFIVREPDRL